MIFHKRYFSPEVETPEAPVKTQAEIDAEAKAAKELLDAEKKKTEGEGGENKETEKSGKFFDKYETVGYPKETTPAIEATPTTKKKTETPTEDDDKKLLDEFITKAKKYDELQGNDLLKSVLEFAQSGKQDPLAFFSEKIGADPSAKSPETLYVEYLKSLGMTDADIYGTEEEPKAMEKFRALEKYEQIEKVAPFKAQQTAEREARLKALASSYRPKEQVQAEEQITEQTRVQEVGKTSQATLDAKIKDMEGKVVSHVTISPVMAKAIKQEVESNPYPIFKDGKLVGHDLEKATRAAMYVLYGDLMEKELLDAARKDGYFEWYQKRANSSKENTSGAPRVVNKKSEAREKAEKEMTGKA